MVEPCDVLANQIALLTCYILMWEGVEQILQVLPSNNSLYARSFSITNQPRDNTNLPVGLRQITSNLPEVLQQISFYLPEELQQISSYLLEDLWQITSSSYYQTVTIISKNAK